MSVVVEDPNTLTEITPMMKQYFDIKEQWKDYILMYRLGDFYEMFFGDAKTASEVLELTLTGRDCGGGQRAPMCGVPFHKADVYIGRLVERGFKVAVCEQMEDPATTKGLVRRDVIRVVTPGTVTDGSMLSDGENNYLTAICVCDEGIALGFADISTGQLSATCLEREGTEERTLRELGLYRPREAIINTDASRVPKIVSFMKEHFDTMISDGRVDLFDASKCREIIISELGVEVESSLPSEAVLRVAGALIGYIRETQIGGGTYINSINVYSDSQYMELDLNTQRNLELFESMRSKTKKGSLLWVLDRTQTAMGARMLRSWLQKPLVSPDAIERRQRAVGDFVDDFVMREELRDCLSKIYDLERLTAKAVYGTANAKDARAIGQSLAYLPDIKRNLLAFRSDRICEISSSLDILDDLCSLIDSALVADPPLSVRDGGMIRDGYDEDIDRLRSIMQNGKGWIEEIERRERESTGIKTLRIGYNKVFGYYIEVTKSFVSQVPERYIRKQTTTNSERYITEELKDMEATILGAADKLGNLEFAIFQKVRETIAAASDRILATSAKIAELDVYLSLADVASRYNYTCPEVDTGDVVSIKDGRHPVVERYMNETYFVPNDAYLDTRDNRMNIITGPNMAGKSTYMRQVAIIVVMAQIGSYVPAREATVGVVDKVFTRIGASDDLASGQSTFMLEMTEVAHILRNATKHSLIVYDEVGRGTSTYDGMSIARAVLEYTLGKKLGAKTLFATHYHELTSLENEYDGVVNYNIAAKKRDDGVIFLRKIVRGATDDSYGIEVAKLAGLPNETVRRAKEILAGIESGGIANIPSKGARKQEKSLADDLFAQIEDSKSEEVADRLRAVDLNVMTPIEALNLVFELKKILS